MVESASLTTGVLATAVLVLLTCCIYLRSRQRSAHARQLDFEAARNNKLSDLEAGGTTPRAGDSSGSSPLDSARAKPPPLPPKTPTTPRRGDLRAAVDSRKALAAESRELRRDIATTPRGTAAAAPAADPAPSAEGGASEGGEAAPPPGGRRRGRARGAGAVSGARPWREDAAGQPIGRPQIHPPSDEP